MQRYDTLNEIFEGTIAQGTFARSSAEIIEDNTPETPITPTEDHEEFEDDSNLSTITSTPRTASGSSFTRKRKQTSSSHAVAEALKSLADLNKNKEENIGIEGEAIKILQENYQNLDESDLIIATSVFENSTKAKIFKALCAGSLRDGWLEREIEKQKLA